MDPTTPQPEIGPDENPWTARLRSTIAKLKHLDLTGQVTYDEIGKKELGWYFDLFVGNHSLPDGRNTKVAVKRRRHIPGESDDRAVKVSHSCDIV